MCIYKTRNAVEFIMFAILGSKKIVLFRVGPLGACRIDLVLYNWESGLMNFIEFSGFESAKYCKAKSITKKI